MKGDIKGMTSNNSALNKTIRKTKEPETCYIVSIERNFNLLIIDKYSTNNLRTREIPT